MNDKQTIYIRQEAWAAMLQHCIDQKPREACGFLFETNGVMELFIPVANIHDEPERHYLMDPKEMIQVMLTGHCGNSIPAGIVHSHPRTPPVPSAEDTLSSWRTAALHWIVSLLNPQAPEVKVYEYVKETRWIAHRIEVLD